MPVNKTRPDRQTHATKATAFKQPVEFRRGVDRTQYWMLETDFVEVAGSTLPAWLAKSDTSAAGAPVTDYVANQPAGVYRLKEAADDEAERLVLYGGDHLLLNPAKDPWMVARVKLDTTGAALTADERIVIGLASATNATLDTVATNAWFRVEGANWNLLTESDDGTTDDDDNDSTLDWSDNAWALFAVDIDFTNKLAYFQVDLGAGNGWQMAGPPLAMAALTANMLLQPYIHIQKDGGTETQDVLVDYLAIGAAR